MADNINWSDSGEESDLAEQSNCKIDNRRCTYCFKILKSSSNIPEHIKLCEIACKSSARLVTCKNGLEKFICDICCRTFKYLRFLAEHEKRHDPPGGFLCKYCDGKYCTEVEREKHTEDKHKVFKCQICKSILQTAENYIEHIKKLHNGQNREYKSCNDCGRLYSSPLILKYHQDTNCGLNGIFKCDECEKTFQTKGRLKIHKLIHSNEKNFCCIYCGQKFRRFMNLQSHELKHTGMKPYQCNVCQKSFSHRASLSTHSTTHTGLKPYLCQLCGLRFSCASNIIQHRKKRPDTCGLPEYCTKLPKACPIANLKNLNLLTAEVPIKIFKAVKVINENENESKNVIKRLKRNTEINCYQCTDKIFKQNSLYMKHLRDYHKKSNDEIEKLLEPINLKCSICGKLYKLAKNLEKHLKTHCTNANVKDVCNKLETKVESNCDLKSDLENYEIVEAKVEMKFENISENISTSNNITNSQIKSESLEDHINAVTSKISLNNNSIQDVEEIAVNFVNATSKEITINDCKVSVSKDTDPLQNEQNNSKKESIKLSCPECNDQIFPQKSLFIRHLRGRIHNKSEDEIEKLLTSLNDGKTNSKCNICGKLYTIPYYLKQHLKTHDESIRSAEDFHNLKTEKLVTGRKIIRCYKCVDEIFYFKSVYIRHLRSRHHNKSTEEIEVILNELNEKNDDKFNQNKTEENTTNPKLQLEDEENSKQQLNNSMKNSISCVECNKKNFRQKNEYIKHLRGRSHNKTEEEIAKIIDNLNNKKSNLKCNICGKLYTIQYYFEKHLKAHDGVVPTKAEDSQQSIENNLLDEKKIIRCYKCTDQVFTQKCLYIRHLRGRHHNKTEKEIAKILDNLNGTKSNLTCNICGKLYTMKYHLQKHLKAHDKDNVSLNKSENFPPKIEHNFDGKKIIRCYKCTDLVFTQKCLYIRHLRGRHHNKSEEEIDKLLNIINGNESNLKCKICKKIYTIPYYLKKHLKTHGIDATHKCNFCDEYFINAIEVLTHTQTVHKDQLTCSICIKTFPDFDSVMRHNQFVHSNKEKKQFICIKCGKKMSSKIALNDHELSNCGQNPIYRCDVCGKGLSTAGILKSHMMLHSNRFPYKCSYCQKGFRFNDKLKEHLRCHTGEKPFKCPYCDKAFGHSSTLYIHVSTHTGIKRYMCTTCSDRFSCISGLKAHWRTHPTTCGADPNRTTKPQIFMGYRKGKLVTKKDIVD